MICSAAAQSSAAAKAPACVALQLSAAVDDKESEQVDGGVGNHAITLAIQNVSPSTCFLQGVPGLASFDASNHPLPVWVCQNCPDYLFQPQPVTEVLLLPRRSAYVVVGYSINDGAGTCIEPAWLDFFLSGDLHPLRARLSGIYRFCGEVTITPFLPKPPIDGFLPNGSGPEK